MSAAGRALPALLAALAMAAAAWPAAGEPSLAQRNARARNQPVFEPADAKLPRLRWPDGSLSVNDRCPVTLTRLARDIAPLFVNGRPVGFC